MRRGTRKGRAVRFDRRLAMFAFESIILVAQALNLISLVPNFGSQIFGLIHKESDDRAERFIVNSRQIKTVKHSRSIADFVAWIARCPRLLSRYVNLQNVGNRPKYITLFLVLLILGPFFAEWESYPT
ncbi:hypothetical protein [Herpetosiphon gulosus]|uniref:hypothetical protein n=1 Tax=Herpetosiphon gulosus TaxID=1973496 RepID=UPI0031EFAD45